MQVGRRGASHARPFGFALAPFGFRELPSANLKLTSPELAAARAMCLDYFLAVTKAVFEAHLCLINSLVD